MIRFGAEVGAPAIIGSMQGRATSAGSRPQALRWLADSLVGLQDVAASAGQVLLVEPLNRYETNLINTIQDGLSLIRPLGTNLKLLADLFHMNIEEVDMAAALRSGGDRIGHIHFVDSNRHAAGLGHLDFASIAQAITAMSFGGYLSAEALAVPDSMAAAEATISSLHRLFPDTVHH
jgi:sugar phosphate isomerase/epimerase